MRDLTRLNSKNSFCIFHRELNRNCLGFRMLLTQFASSSHTHTLTHTHTFSLSVSLPTASPLPLSLQTLRRAIWRLSATLDSHRLSSTATVKREARIKFLSAAVNDKKKQKRSAPCKTKDLGDKLELAYMCAVCALCM